MMKRSIALCLAIVMLLSLAACGGEGVQKAAEEVKLDDTVEYKGEMPIVKPGDEPITLTIGIATNSNVTDYKNNDLTKWLEETTGLNLEFVQFNGTQAENATQIALMTAGLEGLNPGAMGLYNGTVFLCDDDARVYAYDQEAFVTEGLLEKLGVSVLLVGETPVIH